MLNDNSLRYRKYMATQYTSPVHLAPTNRASRQARQALRHHVYTVRFTNSSPPRNCSSDRRNTRWSYGQLSNARGMVAHHHVMLWEHQKQRRALVPVTRDELWDTRINDTCCTQKHRAAPDAALHSVNNRNALFKFERVRRDGPSRSPQRGVHCGQTGTAFTP